MIDFRALCEELLADYEQNRFRVEIAAEARAALAEQPVGPTDEEIRTFASFGVDFDCYETTDKSGNIGIAWECSDSQLLDFARAVLARWGQSAHV